MCSKTIEEFLNLLEVSNRTLEIEQRNLQEHHQKEIDLLHILELEDLDRNTKSKVLTRLQRNRKERRYSKNCVEVMTPIAEYLKENKNGIDKLKETLGKVRKKENYHNSRTYMRKYDWDF